MLAENPDIVCLDTAYPDFVNLLCEQLFLQDYKGQIISCTLDFYGRIIEKTSTEFLEGLIFQFPDFDDPAMNEPHINFENPNEFFVNYNERFPDAWSAVTWEYPAIAEMWRLAAEKAGSVEPMDVFASLKEGGRGPPCLRRRRLVGRASCGGSTTRWSATGRWCRSRTARPRSSSTATSSTGGTSTASC